MSKLFYIFAIVMMLIRILLNVGDEAPQLIIDRSSQIVWEPASELKIDSNECKKYLLVMTTCDIYYSRKDDTDEYSFPVSYIFFGTWTQEPMQLLWARDEHQLVTTASAIKHYTARLLAVLIGLILPKLLLLSWFIYRLVRQFKPKRQAKTAQIRIPERIQILDAPPPRAAPLTAGASSGPRQFGRRGQ